MYSQNDPIKLATCLLVLGTVIVLPHNPAFGQSGSGAPFPQVGISASSGQGPRATGTANTNDITLPDTPAGRCVATFLEAFNSGDSRRMEEFESHCRAASQSDQRSAQDRVDQFKQIRDELGTLSVMRVESASPTEIVIRALSSRASALWSVGFEFDAQSPYGLVTLRFRPYSKLDAGGRNASACGAEPPKERESAATPPANEPPVDLPDTPMGRCVAAYLEAFNSNNDARMREFESRCRAVSAARNRSIQDRIDQANQIRDDLGNLTLLRLLSAGPSEIAILALSSRTGEAWTLAFEFENEPAAGLVTLRVTPSSATSNPELYSTPIEDALRKDTIRQICDLLREAYVDPDVGKRMAEALTEHEAKGHYSTVTSAADLAQRLTADMRAVYRDGHLGIVPFGGPAAPKGCGAETVDKDYGFRKAELLPGNIGYIKFDIFMSSDEARKAAAAALASVAGCDALIFDLRDNVGGSPRMVEFIASYLFDKPTHLDSFFDSSGDKMMEIWTLDAVPGRRFANDLAVYILTSSSTVSAAEGFAYDLQQLGRAIVVGARTAGAAHMVTDRLINGRFLIHLPYLKEINPVTNGNWEGTGVIPDISVPAPEALAAAQKDAADKLRARRKGL